MKNDLYDTLMVYVWSVV